jgi:hypothetical protein
VCTHLSYLSLPLPSLSLSLSLLFCTTRGVCHHQKELTSFSFPSAPVLPENIIDIFHSNVNGVRLWVFSPEPVPLLMLSLSLAVFLSPLCTHSIEIKTDKNAVLASFGYTHSSAGVLPVVLFSAAYSEETTHWRESCLPCWHWSP